MFRASLVLIGLTFGAALVATSATCRDRQATPATPADADARFARERMDMVRTQLAARDITNARVLDAMGRVPRHRLSRPHIDNAYDTGRALGRANISQRTR